MNILLITALLISVGAIAYLIYQNGRLKNNSTHFENSFQKQREYYENAVKEKNLQISNLNQSNKSTSEKIERLTAELATAKADYTHLQELHRNQKKELSEFHRLFKNEFRSLSETILEEKSKKFSTHNQEQLKQIISPLKERIQNFEKKLEENSKETVGWNSALKEQIQSLKDLNIQITKEADQLTRALKGDVKTQGNWGELQLEKILQYAGLEENTHYSKEKSFEKGEDKKTYRPDYIIHLPDDRNLVLDAKVSLSAFSNYFEADDEDDQNKHLKSHINSVRNHIKVLSAKNYQDIHQINQPDYIMMFLANESALTMAVQHDDSLYEKALNSNIVLVSASTLMATLKTISYIWKQKNQEENARNIAVEAGRMYDKFVGFYENMNHIGDLLHKTSDSFNGALNKLKDGKGNLIEKAKKLKQMGIPTKKEISD